MDHDYFQAINDIIHEDPHHPVHVALGLQCCGEIITSGIGGKRYPALWHWYREVLTLEDVRLTLVDHQQSLENTHIPYHDPEDNGLRERIEESIKQCRNVATAVLFSVWFRFGDEFSSHSKWTAFEMTLAAVEKLVEATGRCKETR